MLSVTAVGLVVIWIAALAFSVTLGGWIHLLPIIAELLFISRLTKAEPEAPAYVKWKLARARRLRR